MGSGLELSRAVCPVSHGCPEPFRGWTLRGSGLRDRGSIGFSEGRSPRVRVRARAHRAPRLRRGSLSPRASFQHPRPRTERLPAPRRAHSPPVSCGSTNGARAVRRGERPSDSARSLRAASASWEGITAALSFVIGPRSGARRDPIAAPTARLLLARAWRCGKRFVPVRSHGNRTLRDPSRHRARAERTPTPPRIGPEGADPQPLPA